MKQKTGSSLWRRLRAPEEALWDRIFTTVYLVFLGLVTLVAFRTTTMLTEAQIGWMGWYLPELRLALLLFVGAKLARERSWRPEQILMAILLCGALLRSWQRVERDFVPELILLILGAHGEDFKKIVRVHLAVAGVGLMITMVLALAGFAENLVYVRGGGQRRMAFGILYPTDFAAQVFYLTACWAWLRERNMTLWEIAGLLGLAAFCLVFCDARNSVLCMALLAAGLLYCRLRRRRGERRGQPYVMARPVQRLLALSGPLLGTGMLLATRLYTNQIPWLSRLDDRISYRFSVGHKMMSQYGVTLFGQDVYMTGLGGNTDPVRVIDYYFLDSSYLNILLCFGLVTLLCVLGAMVVSAMRECRLGAWERLGILALVALHCVMEHHLLELHYNVFLLLPLAVTALPEPSGSSAP